jgi:hypothetical protein
LDFSLAWGFLKDAILVVDNYGSLNYVLQVQSDSEAQTICVYVGWIVRGYERKNTLKAKYKKGESMRWNTPLSQKYCNNDFTCRSTGVGVIS